MLLLQPSWAPRSEHLRFPSVRCNHRNLKTHQRDASQMVNTAPHRPAPLLPICNHSFPRMTSSPRSSRQAGTLSPTSPDPTTLAWISRERAQGESLRKHVPCFQDLQDLQAPSLGTFASCFRHLPFLRFPEPGWEPGGGSPAGPTGVTAHLPLPGAFLSTFATKGKLGSLYAS